MAILLIIDIYLLQRYSSFYFLLQEREKMLKHFQELKAQMNKVREAERDKLTKVTLESNSAIKEVKRQNDKVSANK
jgi:hypothetical protein